MDLRDSFIKGLPFTCTQSACMFYVSVLYGLITFCLFLLLPFMYFFYEEREEDASCKSVSLYQSGHFLF